VRLHALSLSFVLYYHHVYERGRSSETVIPIQLLVIVSSLVTFMMFYFLLLNLEITKTLLLTLLRFDLVYLRVVGA
jgi:hypothetical protein